MTAIAARRRRVPAQPPRQAAAVPTVLLTAVAWPVLASYAALVAIATVLVLSAGSDVDVLSTVLAGGPLWVAAHQAPLSVALPGAEPGTIGVLPLLVTLGLAALVARSAAGAMGRLGWDDVRRAAVVALAFAAGHGALGVLVALGGMSTRLTVGAWQAALACAAVAGSAAFAGAVRAAGVARALAGSVPPWAVRGVFAGLRGLAVLLAGGAVLVVLGLAVSLGTAGEVLASWSGTPGGRFGAIVVSVLYAPNAVVAAVSWAVGPGFTIGAVASGPFGTTAGALPAVPLLAALPEPSSGPWGVAALVLPALAGVAVGRAAARWPGAVDLSDRLRAVSLGGAVAAVSCAVLAVGAGGRLGGGAFDPVTVPPGALAVVVFVWLVAPAVVTVAIADRAARHAALAAVVADARAAEADARAAEAGARAAAGPDDDTEAAGAADAEAAGGGDADADGAADGAVADAADAVPAVPAHEDTDGDGDGDGPDRAGSGGASRTATRASVAENDEGGAGAVVIRLPVADRGERAGRGGDTDGSSTDGSSTDGGGTDGGGTGGGGER